MQPSLKAFQASRPSLQNHVVSDSLDFDLFAQVPILILPLSTWFPLCHPTALPIMNVLQRAIQQRLPRILILGFAKNFVAASHPTNNRSTGLTTTLTNIHGSPNLVNSNPQNPCRRLPKRSICRISIHLNFFPRRMPQPIPPQFTRW